MQNTFQKQSDTTIESAKLNKIEQRFLIEFKPDEKRLKEVLKKFDEAFNILSIQNGVAKANGHKLVKLIE